MIRAETTTDTTTRRGLYRLDVQRPGEPMVPHSFHDTGEEAFDAGLVAITGRCDITTEPPPGWDFTIVSP